jgi:hypothetical protein
MPYSEVPTRRRNDLQPDRLFDQRQRFFRKAETVYCLAERKEGIGVLWIKDSGPFEILRRPLELPKETQHPPEAGMGDRRPAVEGK